MNALQGVSERVNYFVSLNAQISEGDVLREIDYEHPLFDLRAIDAQSQIQALNDPGSGTKTHFIGAWTRYGFHEDGLLSAVNLCQQLMGADPWLMR